MKLFEPLIAMQAELSALRRDIHAHPELRYEEERTSALVAAQLAAWGIPVTRGMGGTGVVGVIRKGSSARVIGLRADMDALPMQEVNTFPHASRHAGKMHACGHDGHTAMLLGAARCLAQEVTFDGTVVLIFQPAEESGGGAQRMMDDGLFEKFPVDAVFGMHNWPGMPVGQFGVRVGAMMAASNEFELVLTGRGAHGGQPHRGADPVPAAAAVIQAWQSIVSRNLDPLQAGVISVTQLQGGNAKNVIPEQVRLGGTVRAFSDDNVSMLEERMEAIARHTALAYGVQADFRFERIYPALVNHEHETGLALAAMRDIVGAEQVDAEVEPSMGAEDFAFMLGKKTGCYVFIGNGQGEHRMPGHGPGPCNIHNPSYDFNDDLLPIGASYWIRLVQRFLQPA